MNYENILGQYRRGRMYRILPVRHGIGYEGEGREASRLFLVQMLAIENIEQTKGFGKSSSPIADGTHHRRRLPDWVGAEPKRFFFKRDRAKRRHYVITVKGSVMLL